MNNNMETTYTVTQAQIDDWIFEFNIIKNSYPFESEASANARIMIDELKALQPVKATGLKNLSFSDLDSLYNGGWVSNPLRLAVLTEINKRIEAIAISGF